jgi:hypothetical protein
LGPLIEAELERKVFEGDGHDVVPLITEQLMASAEFAELGENIVAAVKSAADVLVRIRRLLYCSMPIVLIKNTLMCLICSPEFLPFNRSKSIVVCCPHHLVKLSMVICLALRRPH